MSARIRIFTALAPMTAIIFSVGCGHEEPHTTTASLEPLKVEITEVSLVSETKAIEVRGVVQPARQASVSSRVMGPVIALKVNAGSSVAKGQTLLEIQPEAADGQLAQARGALTQAQAALALAERNLQRYEALHAEKAASELELDMARMQFEQAIGAVEQANGAVKSASSVASESVVRAPFAGRVIETLVEVGDLAAPGRSLVRIESLEGQQIWLNVGERDVARVSLGDEIDVRLDARPDLGTLKGVVDEIVPSADPATHTLTIKAALGGVEVPSGFSGRATIAGDPIDRLVIPAQTVHRRGGLELVVVRSADGTARTRAVTTGSTLADGRIEVLSGVSAGEAVVVNAPGPVADGTPLELGQ
jgi:RND family efflux transporter MFP subunit